MNERLGLIEWFQNLNTWIKRCIALVVGIVGFIILFRENFHLVVVVIVTFILVTLLVIFVYIISRTIVRSVMGQVVREKYKFKRGRYVAILGIVLEIAIIFILFAFKPSRSFISIAFIGIPTLTSTMTQTLTQTTTITPNPTITPTITPKVITNPVEIQFPWFMTDDWPGYGHIDDIMSAKEAVLGETARSAWGLSDTFYDSINTTPKSNVSLLGSATLGFGVENTAESFQANIDEIKFNVEKDPVDPIEDIWMYPPELGGGHPRGFQVTLDYSDAPSASRTQTFIATPGENEDFDFISLAPGERENILVSISIPSPGNYHVTPIVKITYRNQIYEHALDTIDLMVPGKYRFWGYQNGELIPSPIIMDNETGDLLLQSKSSNLTNIPILFVSSMINGFSKRIFISEDDFITSPIDLVQEVGFLEANWSEDSDQIIYQYVGDRYAFDLQTKKISELNPDLIDSEFNLRSEIKSIIEIRYSENIASITESPNGDFLAIVIEHLDEIIENRTNSGQIIIVDTDNFEVIEVKGSSNWCDKPSWSPDGQSIAFVCRHDKNNDGIITDSTAYYFAADETDLLVADINGTTNQLNTNRGIYFDPVWSQDGELILVGGDGIRIFESKQPNILTTIFETPLGYCFHPQWKP